MRSILYLGGCIPLLAACGQQGTKPTTPPVHIEVIGHETELLRLTLTPQAQQRLGIVTVRVGTDSAAARRETSGEIVVPAGAGGVPTGSLSNVAQIGTQQVAADGEIARARAQAQLARVALGRAEALVREEAGSVRARDEAAATLATAQAAVNAADSVVLVVYDGPGVDSADAGRLFQRFSWTERSRSSSGHGLGLALVQAIAGAHHGEARLLAASGFAMEVILSPR